jgi:CDP-Glycerol:Poly(glycerophosphate) glycerophosphotransferase
VAMIDRPVVYYQFDEKEFFDQQSSYTRGYFDYCQDGFGPVVTSHNEVITAANEILENRGSWHETYGPRIQNFFAFQDDENCARVVAAIEALDQPRGEAEEETSAAHSQPQPTISETWTSRPADTVASWRWRFRRPAKRFPDTLG